MGSTLAPPIEALLFCPSVFPSRISQSGIRDTREIRVLRRLLTRKLFRERKAHCRNQDETLIRKRIAIVTHLIESEQLELERDRYFGLMASELRRKGNVVKILYIDHRHQSGSAKDAYREKGLVKADRKILDMSLQLIDIVSYGILTGRYLAAMLVISMGKRKSYKWLNTVQIMLSKRTYAVHGLCRRIVREVEKNKCDVLMTTFEGHAWEQGSYLYGTRENRGLLTIGYMHSFIFGDSCGIMGDFGRVWCPNKLWLTGSFQGERLAGKRVDCKLEIVGDLGGARLGRDKSNKDRVKGRILIVAEGGDYEHQLMLRYAQHLSETYKTLEIVLRVHPLRFRDTIKDEVVRSKGLRIDTETLTESAKKSEFVVFRNSTAVIDCMKLGCVPIYLDDGGELVSPVGAASVVPKMGIRENLQEFLATVRMERAEVVEIAEKFKMTRLQEEGL